MVVQPDPDVKQRRHSRRSCAGDGEREACLAAADRDRGPPVTVAGLRAIADSIMTPVWPDLALIPITQAGRGKGAS